MADPIAIDPASIAPHIPVAPGGTVVLQGQWHVAGRDLVIDPCQSGPSTGGATGAGAFDYTAGGWQLQSRDWSNHTCHLVATGAPAPACSQAGSSAPCLPSRLRQIANTLDNPLSVSELRAQIVGGIHANVLSPEAAALVAPPPPPSFLERNAMGLGAGVLALVITLVGARTLARKRKTPEAQVRRMAAKVRARLNRADPVYQRLAPMVDDLARQADELVSLRDRLRTKVANADREGTLRRRDELAARANDTAEAADARTLVEERLSRIDRWKAESERAGARLDRILEYLRALDGRLDDAMDSRSRDASGAGIRVETDVALLGELERDVQSALEGAREADRLTASSR
jgi:hypothetical protein